MDYILKRGKWFYYKRRVPVEIQKYHDKAVIQASLKTDSEQLAKQRATIFNSELEKLWEGLVLDNESKTSSKLSKAKHIARIHGFSYSPATHIAESPIKEIIHRVNAVKDDISNNPDKVEAILGKHEDNKLSISNSLEVFFDFQKPNLSNKSPQQIVKWQNPRKKSVHNFIQVIGDLPVNEITRKDVLKFRSWWVDRIENDGLSENSANKDFSYLRTLVCFIRDHHVLDMNIEAIFSRIQLKETKSSRPPFPTSYIKDTLLNFDNLKGLNRECQLLLFAMADTGARPSELLGLNAERGDIVLDAPIPYIFIRPDKKKALKTTQSERQIPLVGASLFAFKELAGGFDHYYQKADTLSANINKFLNDRNLLPSSKHSLYSLRHSFEDRLTAVEPPEKVQSFLMGHKYRRERYGDGPTLEQKKKWLDMMCFNEFE